MFALPLAQTLASRRQFAVGIFLANSCKRFAYLIRTKVTPSFLMRHKNLFIETLTTLMNRSQMAPGTKAAFFGGSSLID
jgi:hypothetical protein